MGDVGLATWWFVIVGRRWASEAGRGVDRNRTAPSTVLGEIGNIQDGDAGTVSVSRWLEDGNLTGLIRAHHQRPDHRAGSRGCDGLCDISRASRVEVNGLVAEGNVRGLAESGDAADDDRQHGKLGGDGH